MKRRCVGIRLDKGRCTRKPLENTDRCSLHPRLGRTKRDGRKSVNLPLSAPARAKLSELSTKLGVSRSEVIEEWLAREEALDDLAKRRAPTG